MMSKLVLFAAVSSFTAQPARAEPVHGSMDLQSHLAMHMTLPFTYGDGPEATDPHRRPIKAKHLWRQQMHVEWLVQSRVPIIGVAALAADFAHTRRQARRMLNEQLDFVENFAARYADRFEIARTPEDARRIVAGGKQALIQGIEGAHLALDGPEDARHWASRGVAIVTPIHLKDDEFGGAGLPPDAMRILLNFKGTMREIFRPRYRRGLTAQGREAMRWLTEAGIVIDLSHMTQESLKDTLEETRALGASPIVTHGMLGAIRSVERGVSDGDIQEIYRQGGLFGLPVTEASLDPRRTGYPVPEGYCPSSIDGFRLSYEHLLRLAGPGAAVGWSGDFNGWANHMRPKWGKKGCQPLENLRRAPRELDTRGLAHPGLLPEVWRTLREEGADLDPLERSAEAFLEIWERTLRSAGR
jgi:microsomal dipeptidase-like Zn-dependent dipeptidase